MNENEKFLANKSASAMAKAELALNIIMELSILLVEKGILSKEELETKIASLLHE